MKKITEQTKQDIIYAFYSYANSGIPEEHLVRLLADHAIGLLQIADENDEWFEPTDKHEKDSPPRL